MQLLTLRHGDCVARMAEMPEGNIDAIVCDPPYGLEFQGKAWDAPWKEEEGGTGWRTNAGMSKVGLGGRGIPWPSFAGGDSANATCATCGGRMRGAKKCACETPEWRVKGKPLDQTHTKTAQMQAFGKWSESWLREAYRVLKPGGVLMAFGGTRTHHRLSAAMKAVGFTDLSVRAWSYATGFPKSLNVSKAMDSYDKTKIKQDFVRWMKTTPLKALEIDEALKSAGLIKQGSCFAVHWFNETQPAIPTQAQWAILEGLCHAAEVVPPDWISDAVEMRETGSKDFKSRRVVGQKRSSLGGTVAAGVYEEELIAQHRGTIFNVTAPATEAARQWEGYGTALRPSWEPVICGKKSAGGKHPKPEANL